MRKHDPAETSAKKRPTRGADDEAKPRRGVKIATKGEPAAATKKAPAKTPRAKAPVATKKAAAKPIKAPAKAPAKPAKKAAAKPTKAPAKAKSPAPTKAKRVAAKTTTARARAKAPVAAPEAIPKRGARARAAAAGQLELPIAAPPPQATKAPAKAPAAKSAAKAAAERAPAKAAAEKAPAKATAEKAPAKAAAEKAPAKAAAEKAPAKATAEKAAAEKAPAKEGSIEALARAAEAGDRRAAARLGDAYYAGRGAPHDVAEAERWWTHAATLGEMAAKESLANLYAEGEGAVRQDLDRALALFRECATAGLDVGELVEWIADRIAARRVAEPEPPLPRDEGEAVAALARRAGLERVAERVSSLRRSSVRLVPTGIPAAVGASKLGGVPDLAEGAAWPKGPGGERLAFVAQLDCAELWPMDHEQRLPSEGLIWLFVDAKGGRARGAIDPRACAVLFDAAPLGVARASGGVATVDERAVAPTSEPTLPFAGARAVRDLGLDEDEAEGYATLRDELLSALWAGPGTPLARSLGHADAASAADPGRAALDDASTGATLLLEVDARTLGGAGRLCVFLRDADLADRRFAAAYARLVR